MASNPYAVSPIKKLGYTSFADYTIFKKYLLLPKVYLRGILLRYPVELMPAVIDLPKLLDTCDTHHWRIIRNMELSHEEANRMLKYRMARVPPSYMQRNELPACAGNILAVVSDIISEPVGFAGMGRVLYFHSQFEENSLLAASNIVKAGVRAGMKCIMLPFTTYMSEAKTFETSALMEKVKESDLVVLSMLGCEYVHKESGFTEAHLEEITRLRSLSGKSTILSSHLSPAGFKERYKMDLERLGAISMKFEDSGITLTVNQLAKELAALREGKK